MNEKPVKKKVEAKKVSIYLRKEQFEYLDSESEKLGVSRSKFIEMKIFPKALQVLMNKKGTARKKD